jgi:anti-anti-sigma factor
MPSDSFKLINVSTLDDVVLIEIMSTNIQGPELATQFSAELCAVANQDSTRPILLDMHRCGYLSSMGYSGLFKLVKRANEQHRRVKFCNMHPDVESGAEAVGLYHVVKYYNCQEAALAAFKEA